MMVPMAIILLFRHSKEPKETKEPEKTPEEPTKESEVEQKDASETKQAEEKVTLHPVKTTKWRVENSWGDDKGDKGYLMMSDKWLACRPNLVLNTLCLIHLKPGKGTSM